MPEGGPAGRKVVTLSGPDGYIYDPDGVTTQEKFDYMLEMRASGRDKVQDYADKFGCEFHAGEKPWSRKVDIIMPSATQNDVTMEWAEKIVATASSTTSKWPTCPPPTTPCAI